MKKSVKRIIAVTIGFAFAMLLMSVFIYIGKPMHIFQVLKLLM